MRARKEESEEEEDEPVPFRKRAKDLRLITVANERGEVIMKLAVQNTRDLLEAWANDFRALHGSLHMLRGNELQANDEIFDEMILLATHRPVQQQQQRAPPDVRTHVIDWSLLWDLAIDYMIKNPKIQYMNWDDVLTLYFDRKEFGAWWRNLTKDERTPWKSRFRDAHKDRYRGGVWDTSVRQARENQTGMPDPGATPRKR